MKIKILTSFPKQTYTFDNVYFSSDLHLDHQAVLDFGRKFESLEWMNKYIIDEINIKVNENDLLVLLGDTLMNEKDYTNFLNKLNCDNIIILFGNHCNRGKLYSSLHECDKLLFVGDYLELSIDKQIICCQHYPLFNWNYQDQNSFSLHGHLHADESDVVKEIHKYKSMDVGIDSYHKVFGTYSVYSFLEIKEILKDKLTIGRHE